MKMQPTHPRDDADLVEHKAMDAAILTLICAAGAFVLVVIASIF